MLAFTLPQGPELIIILGVLVLLFGARKLPELGGAVGRTITNFRKGMDEAKDELDAAKDGGDDTEAEDVADGEGERQGAEDRDTT
ncbi:twin-arginine translocase TatA/TatE family subunit [Egibacter rhizosphaerae]|uniref:Sec-independent protein translocase protein TatA n=1 Tax=Egibacter rhizosphaerae TaxID=1670831 RepID=A0A411YKJ8_9ACTN|nr:twin-arginine translocase TatA/TatE family subunit [Egibacter rhizosphaerae]QBI21715.1 twin-arginine translocase TatA/TatE family subunit [Egibacter rhizosphaerae]